MNNVNIIGRLVRDTELTYFETDKGKTAGTRNSVAVDRNKDQVDFLEIKALGKIAERINQYTKKGDLVGISGRMQQDSWEKDGKKYYSTYIFVNQIQFLSKKEGAKTEAKPYEEEGVWGSAKDIDITTEELPFYQK